MRAFAEAKGLAFGKALTPEIWTALAPAGKDPVIAEYTITDERRVALGYADLLLRHGGRAA